MNLESDRKQLPEVYAPYLEEEVHLRDLLLDAGVVLFKRRLLVISIIALCVLAVVSWKVINPDSYEYRTSLEIGMVEILDDQGRRTVVPIEDLEGANSKLTDAYIPAAIREFQSNNSAEDTAIDIETEIPKNSLMLVMSSNGRPEQDKIHLEIQRLAAGKLIEDHKRLANSRKLQLKTELAEEKLKLRELEQAFSLELRTVGAEQELDKAKMEKRRIEEEVFWEPEFKKQLAIIKENKDMMASLHDQRELLMSQQARLAELKTLLGRQLQQVESLINDSFEQRKIAIQRANDNDSSLSRLLIDSDVERLLSRRANIEERLYNTLSEEADKINKELEDIKRQEGLQIIKVAEAESELNRMKAERDVQLKLKGTEIKPLEIKVQQVAFEYQQELDRQRLKVENAQSALDNVVETRTILEPTKSLKPSGTSLLIALLVAILVGGVVGVFVAFFVEFFSKVRQRMDEEQTA